MVLQLLPHLQKLDGFTLQADFQVFSTPSDVQQSLHLPDNTTYNYWYVNSKGLVHPNMTIIHHLHYGNIWVAKSYLKLFQIQFVICKMSMPVKWQCITVFFIYILPYICAKFSAK